MGKSCSAAARPGTAWFRHVPRERALRRRRRHNRKSGPYLAANNRKRIFGIGPHCTPAGWVRVPGGTSLKPSPWIQLFLFGMQVGSGMLLAPGVPELVERAEMAKLTDTYGKTWHTWQVDAGHALPFGESYWHSE
jgi:Protein of unknown function (DUF1264)